MPKDGDPTNPTDNATSNTKEGKAKTNDNATSNGIGMGGGGGEDEGTGTSSESLARRWFDSKLFMGAALDSQTLEPHNGHNGPNGSNGHNHHDDEEALYGTTRELALSPFLTALVAGEGDGMVFAQVL